MQILITGAGGFVGSNLHDVLKEKHTVFALKHQDLDLLDANAVKQFMGKHSIDFVLHCANEGGSRKTNYDQGGNSVVAHNLRMFFNLVRCMTPKMRMIHLGSGAEYNRKYYQPKMKESYFDQYPPDDDYGYSKYVISKYIEKCPDIMCLRIFGLFGKYEDYRYKFISNAIVKNLLKMPIVINQNVTFDYLYIDDFCKIVEKFMQPGTYKSFYNITPTHSIDLIGIAHIINDIGKYKSEVIVLNEGVNTEYSGDNSVLLQVMGDFEFESYGNSIKKLYEYYQTVLSTLDVDSVKEDCYLKACVAKRNKE